MFNKGGLLFILFLCTGCMENTNIVPISRIIPLIEFDSIYLDQDFFLISRPGEKRRLVAEGDKESLDKLELRSEDGVLSFLWKEGFKPGNRQIRLILEGPCPIKFKASGWVQISIEDHEDINSLVLEAEDQASLSLTSVNIQKLDLKTKGRSSAHLEGNCLDFKIRTSQSSEVFADQWKAKIIDAQILDFSNVKLWVTDQIGLYTMAKAQTTYKGTPKFKNIRKLGSSKVVALDEKK